MITGLPFFSNCETASKAAIKCGFCQKELITFFIFFGEGLREGEREREREKEREERVSEREEKDSAKYVSTFCS
jgi:hypothetical protein